MLQFQHVCNISHSLEVNYIKYPIKDRDGWRFLGSYSGMSLSVVLIFFLVPLQTSPKLIHSSEVWAVQLLFSEGSWFNSVTFLKLNVGWLSFFSSSAPFWSWAVIKETTGKSTQPCTLLFLNISVGIELFAQLLHIDWKCQWASGLKPLPLFSPVLLQEPKGLHETVLNSFLSFTMAEINKTLWLPQCRLLSIF